jgi:hypothetical protein
VRYFVLSLAAVLSAYLVPVGAHSLSCLSAAPVRGFFPQRDPRHIMPAMYNNGPLSCGMCGIKTASLTLALVWWLALAAVGNAQQPAPDRSTQPDNASGDPGCARTRSASGRADHLPDDRGRRSGQ